MLANGHVWFSKPYSRKISTQSDKAIIKKTTAIVAPGTPSTTTDHGVLTGLSDDDHTQYVKKSTFDAQSILIATSDDTPIVLVLSEQEVAGRLTGGNIDGITIGIADDNILQIDGSPNDDEIARFTANGLEGLTYAELLAVLTGQAGAAFSWNSQNLTSIGDLTAGGLISGATLNIGSGTLGTYGAVIADDATTVLRLEGGTAGGAVLQSFVSDVQEYSIGISSGEDFQIVDVTGASAVPFQILNSAANQALIITSYVGVGADLQLSGNLGVAGDTDLMTFGANTVTVNGALTATGDVLANSTQYVLEGYATGRTIYRQMAFRFTPGATPGTNISCIDVNNAAFEYNAISSTDGSDIAKSGSSGSWSLSADGKDITLDITEAVVMAGLLQPIQINLNNSSTSDVYYGHSEVSSGNINFQIRSWGSNVALDWTTILQAGDRFQFKLTFLTST
jgi:hypothetical protein